MLWEWVRWGPRRCGSRFELALELELGRLTAASSDIVDWASGSGDVYSRQSRERFGLDVLGSSL